MRHSRFASRAREEAGTKENVRRKRLARGVDEPLELQRRLGCAKARLEGMDLRFVEAGDAVRESLLEI